MSIKKDTKKTAVMAVISPRELHLLDAYVAREELRSRAEGIRMLIRTHDSE